MKSPAGVVSMYSRSASTGGCANAYADHGPPHPHCGPILHRMSPVPNNNPDNAAAGYDNNYIENWQPLMPLDARKLTPAQRRVILGKLYRKSFIVYDRLAEL